MLKFHPIMMYDWTDITYSVLAAACNRAANELLSCGLLTYPAGELAESEMFRWNRLAQHLPNQAWLVLRRTALAC
jgi:hypothetical protein